MRQKWDLSPAEALALQKALREQVILRPLPLPIQFVAGADLSYNKHSDEFYSGMVVLDYETMEVVAHSTVVQRAPFPYIPGLLSFRELPSLLDAWQLLPVRPELIFCDGHGIAHPRRLGIAAHFGLETQTPAIGVAKKILTGVYEEPIRQKGRFSPIRDGDAIIGYALCTKDRVKPVFVSPGHLVGLEQSAALTLHCARGYKLPEPTRQAHLLVNRLRRGELKAGVWHRDLLRRT